MGNMSATTRRVLLAKPRGYCAGVDRAVQTVEMAIERYGTPVYVRKQIVHNLHVVRSLEQRGAIFVDENADVPPGSVVVFSAHGIAPDVRAEAEKRGLRVIDATCPLVTKVHNEARRFAAQDYDILLIGHEGHEEVIGTTGEAPTRVRLVDGAEEAGSVDVRDPAKVVWLSQTTLSVDETTETVAALRERFPTLLDPPSDDICYATQNRQLAVKEIASHADLVLVVGSQNSSNSVRLVEVAKDAGATASYLVDDASEIDEVWLDGASTIGVTSGASVPRNWSTACSPGWRSVASVTLRRSKRSRKGCRSPCRARSGRPASAIRLKAEPASLAAHRRRPVLSPPGSKPRDLSLPGFSGPPCFRGWPDHRPGPAALGRSAPPGLPMVSEQCVWILAVPRQWVGVYQRGGQLGDCVH